MELIIKENFLYLYQQLCTNQNKGQIVQFCGGIERAMYYNWQHTDVLFVRRRSDQRCRTSFHLKLCQIRFTVKSAFQEKHNLKIEIKKFQFV